MRPLRHFGSLAAALAVGLALAVAGGVSYLAGAPTIPAKDVAAAAAPASPRASTIRGDSAREGGGAIFAVVDNDHGTLTIKDPTPRHNLSGQVRPPCHHSSGHPIAIG
jgi:hypothetical protein